MTDIPWLVYVGVVVGSSASIAKIAIDSLSYRRATPLHKAQERLTDSEVQVNLARAAGLREEAYAKRDERRANPDYSWVWGSGLVGGGVLGC